VTEDLLWEKLHDPVEKQRRRRLRGDYYDQFEVDASKSLVENIEKAFPKRHGSKIDPQLYPLSEFTFTIRYASHWKNIFGNNPDDEIQQELTMYHRIQGHQDPAREGLKSLIVNKLQSMTACGHFADQMLNNLYFDGAQEREAARISLAEMKVGSPAEVFKLIAEQPEKDRNLILRVEINDNHVFLVDCATASDTVKRLESIVFIRDSDIYNFNSLQFHERLSSRRDTLDKLEIFEYDCSSALIRLAKIMEKCYGHDTLDDRVIAYFDDQVSRNDIFDIVHRLNYASSLKGIKIWGEIEDYL